MYVPPHFKEDRLDVLHDAIREAGLATLVTLGSAGLVASHVPMLLEPDKGRYGMLVGHVSRANPQWRDVADAEALAIFLGPDAYVTPSWYATKHESGKVVPTWNYVAIHAYGRPQFFDDPERLLAIVSKLTDRHEAGRASPWAVSDAPGDFVRGLLTGIVGFELPIARLEGKWKMSQNRSAADRAGVVAGLEAQDNREAAEVAGIVADRSRS
jgi:transcriptional regulator